jgi:hypothetical protein
LAGIVVFIVRCLPFDCFGTRIPAPAKESILFSAILIEGYQNDPASITAKILMRQ